MFHKHVKGCVEVRETCVKNDVEMPLTSINWWKFKSDKPNVGNDVFQKENNGDYHKQLLWANWYNCFRNCSLLPSRI